MLAPPPAGAPVIGISAYSERARWSAWDLDAVVLPQAYAAQVAAAGGVPVLLPPVPGIAVAVRRLDGLVLTGGGDIDPARYGEPPHPRTARVSAERDEAELAALDAALAAGIPVLGICRGLQVLNVARGGTLCQHLPPAWTFRPRAWALLSLAALERNSGDDAAAARCLDEARRAFLALADAPGLAYLNSHTEPLLSER